jgi:hypothetical protein
LATGIPARLTTAEGRKFGLTVGAAFLALAALLWWRGRTLSAPAVAILGVALVLAGVAVPARLGPVQRAWMALGAAISKVTTPIFLGAVYFLAFVPVGFLMRLAGRNPLARARSAGSYWVGRTGVSEARHDLERQF